jgi:hypothetical protein
MIVKIIKIERKHTVFYTITDEVDTNIYFMDVTVKMIRAANPEFTASHLQEAMITTHIPKTVESFHKFVGKEVKINNLYKMVSDPSAAPYAKTAYNTRIETRELSPSEQYIFTPILCSN